MKISFIIPEKLLLTAIQCTRGLYNCVVRKSAILHSSQRNVFYCVCMYWNFTHHHAKSRSEDICEFRAILFLFSS